MKLELFFIRSLFILVTIATIGAMSGMLQSNPVQAQKLVQNHAPATQAS